MGNILRNQKSVISLWQMTLSNDKILFNSSRGYLLLMLQKSGSSKDWKSLICIFRFIRGKEEKVKHVIHHLK